MHSLHLYPILDESARRRSGARDGDLLEMWAKCGARVFQFRAKELDTTERRKRLTEILPIAAELGLRCIINDDLLLHIEEGMGDGFHIGHEDWQALGPHHRQAIAEHAGSGVRPLSEMSGSLTGLSTHSLEQLEQALQLHFSGAFPLSYIALGPCFPTESKTDGLYPTVSVEVVEGALSLLSASGGPDLALIGGVDADRAGRLLHGIQGIRHVRRPGPSSERRMSIFLATIAASMDSERCRQFRFVGAT